MGMRMCVLLQMVVDHIYHPQYVLFTPRGEKYLEHSVIRSCSRPTQQITSEKAMPLRNYFSSSGNGSSYSYSHEFVWRKELQEKSDLLFLRFLQ